MRMKVSTKTIRLKKGVEKIVAITAYDTIFARLADNANVDIILVGDSVGNTFLGFDTTIPVTVDMMLHHTSAVVRANTNAMVVADIPFAEAHKSFDNILDTCSKFIQAGADAVKIEGGVSMSEKVGKLVDAGIPVMGHIGLLPQQFLKLGAYRAYGKDDKEKMGLIDDAKAIAEAGAFSVVLEMVYGDVAKEISGLIGIPTIGIGSGRDCDGQIIVSTDILGLGEYIPSFAKKYSDLRGEILETFNRYSEDVKGGKFPK